MVRTQFVGFPGEFSEARTRTREDDEVDKEQYNGHGGPGKQGFCSATPTRIQEENEKEMKFLIVWISILWLAKGEDEIHFNATKGGLEFERVGILIPEGSEGTMIIKLDLRTHKGNLGNFVRILRRNRAKAVQRAPVTREASVFNDRLGSMLEALDKDEGRQKRSVGEIVGGLLGIFNTAQIHDVVGRIGHTNQAIRETVHEVDAVKDYAEGNAHNIEELSRQERRTLDLLAGIELVEMAIDVWESMREKTVALMDTVMSAMHHRISWRLQELVDFTKIWDEFQQKVAKLGLEIALSDWQHLLQLPCSFAAKNGWIWIILEVPLQQKEAQEWIVYRWQNRPLAVVNSLMHLRPDRELIAVNDRSKATIALTQNELDMCVNLEKKHVCTRPLVQFMENEGTCIQAIWRSDYQEIRRICRADIAPMKDDAWPSKEGLMVTVKDTIDVMIQCGGSRMVRTLTTGMWILRMDQGCKLTTKTWAILMGSTAGITLAVDEQVALTKEWLPTTIRGEEILRNVTMPRTVASVEDKVEAEFAKSGWSPGEIAALTIGLVALVVLAGFILFLWWRLKRGQAIKEGILRSRDEVEEMTAELKEFNRSAAGPRVGEGTNTNETNL